jgi:RraA family protein
MARNTHSQRPVSADMALTEASHTDAGRDFPRATPELLARFEQLPVANIGDAMERMGIVDSSIQAIWPGAHVAGSAYTVWTRSGDNLVLHHAVDLAQPGDVIVVNGGGDTSRALLGELIGVRAKLRGLAGFVIDGAVRDAADLEAMVMPVFARAVTPAGPYKNGPGQLLVPVAIGGVCVMPGDLVVGDRDGVAVVPLNRAAEILELAQAIHVDEDRKRASYTPQAG